jgi:iron complex transport system substrate-binding protein
VDYTGPALADTAAPAESGTRLITDMNGREIEIPTKVSRIVALSSDITLSVLTLGGEDVLVGVDSMSVEKENMARVYPIVQELPEVGAFFDMNEESVLLVDPDVILTVAWHRDPDKTQETLNVPVVCIDADYYKESLELIADVLGGDAKEKAAELIGYYEEKVAAIQDAIADVPEEERTKVYIAGSGGFLSTFGKESAWQFELTDAGGVNVAADIIGGGSHEVSVEQVMLWDPDVIILDDTCSDSLANVLADPRWQSVSAIAEGRVYRVPKGLMDTWGRPHIESVVARVWEAKIFYPDLIDFNVEAEMAGFYDRFFGVTLSDAEIEAILNPE